MPGGNKEDFMRHMVQSLKSHVALNLLKVQVYSHKEGNEQGRFRCRIDLDLILTIVMGFEATKNPEPVFCIKTMDSENCNY